MSIDLDYFDYDPRSPAEQAQDRYAIEARIREERQERERAAYAALRAFLADPRTPEHLPLPLLYQHFTLLGHSQSAIDHARHRLFYDDRLLSIGTHDHQTCLVNLVPRGPVAPMPPFASPPPPGLHITHCFFCTFSLTPPYFLVAFPPTIPALGACVDCFASRDPAFALLTAVLPADTPPASPQPKTP